MANRTYRKTNGKRRITNMNGEWIPVTERLPESGDTVLVRDYGEHLLAWLNFTSNGTAYFSAPGRSNFEVTHWMPLPAPPSDGK